MRENKIDERYIRKHIKRIKRLKTLRNEGYILVGIGVDHVKSRNGSIKNVSS